MDTDDLSQDAYRAIMIESEIFNHDLTLQFGLLSYNCKNEIEFLKKSGTLIEEIRRLDEYELEDFFFWKSTIKKKI